MNCDDMQTQLLDYGWPQKERTQILALLSHAKGCALCKSVLKDLDQLSDDLQGLSDTPWTDQKSHAFLQSVTHQTHAQTSLWKGRAGLLAAAALVLLTVIWPTSPVQEPGVEHARISKADLGRHVTLYKKLSKVFAGNMGWVLVSNPEPDMGVGAVQERPSSLWVVRFHVRQANGQTTQEDMLVVPGQLADISLSLSKEREIRYLVDARQKSLDKVGLKVEVGQSGASAKPGLSSYLALEPSKAVALGQVETTEGQVHVSVSIETASLPKELEL